MTYIFSRERLRRVLKKKTSAELRLSTSSHLHIYIITAHLHHHCTSTFSHLHICASTSLLIFTLSHLRISHLHLSLFFTFSLKAGGGAAGAPRNATLCGARRWLETVENRSQPVVGTVHAGGHQGQIHARDRSAGILCAWLVVAYEHSAQEAVQLLLPKRPALGPWRNRPYVLEALWRLEGLRARPSKLFGTNLRHRHSNDAISGFQKRVIVTLVCVYFNFMANDVLWNT